MLVAVPIYLMVLAYTKRGESQAKLMSRSGSWLVALGVVGYYLASYFDFSGLTYIAASLERVILYLYPTIVLLITSIVFREKINRHYVIAICVSYLGVSVAYAFDGNSSDHINLMKGSFLVFLSAITYACYMVGSQWLIPKFGTVRFTAIVMIVSCLCVIGHYMMTRGVALPEYGREVLWYGTLMGIFSTVIPTFLISEGVSRLGATQASIISSIGPISTIVLSVLILGEAFNGSQVVGTVLVLVGVLYISLNKIK